MNVDELRIIGVNTVSLPLKGANVNPYTRFLTYAVDGLGPPDFDIMQQDLPEQDAVYQGRRAVPREITFRLVLNPAFAAGETYESLRSELYKLFTPGSAGDLEICLYLANKEICLIRGQLKRIEPVLFSKDVEAQVVIQCSESYFSTRYYTYPTMPNPRTESLTINNPGDAPSPLIVTLNVQSALTSIILYRRQNNRNYESITLRKPSGMFAVDDDITITTAPGFRKIEYRPASGGSQQALHFMGASSDWPMLGAGENILLSGNTQVKIQTAYFTPKFLGV